MSWHSRCITASLATWLSTVAGCGREPRSVPLTPPTGSNPQAAYTVSGVAFEHTSTGRRPIAGVRLRLRSSASVGSFLDVTTDANGRYVAFPVGAGMVSIAPVLNSGFFAPCPSGSANTIRGNESIDVHIVSAALLSTAGAPQSLPLTTIYVSGRVYEVTTDGTQPVAGASVELGESASDLNFATTLTNASGNYLVCTTPPGVGTDTYTRLGVSKDGYAPDSLRVMLGWDYTGANVQLIRK